MTITKLGHCCLIIKVKAKSRTEAQASSTGGLTILTDPGDYTTAQNEVRGIDVILITHEHGDHLHVASLKTVFKNNPNARVITNNGVAKILDKEGLVYEILAHGQNITISEVLIEGFGEQHAEIYPTRTRVENTGYFIENRFFYPGDAWTNPGKSIEILALPVGGPWLKISESIDYARELKPKVCFPVHDGGLKHFGSAHRLPAQELPKDGIQFVVPEEGKEMEF